MNVPAKRIICCHSRHHSSLLPFSQGWYLAWTRPTCGPSVPIPNIRATFPTKFFCRLNRRCPILKLPSIRNAMSALQSVNTQTNLSISSFKRKKGERKKCYIPKWISRLLPLLPVFFSGVFFSRLPKTKEALGIINRKTVPQKETHMDKAHDKEWHSWKKFLKKINFLMIFWTKEVMPPKRSQDCSRPTYWMWPWSMTLISQIHNWGRIGNSELDSNVLSFFDFKLPQSLRGRSLAIFKTDKYSFILYMTNGMRSSRYLDQFPGIVYQIREKQ